MTIGCGRERERRSEWENTQRQFHWPRDFHPATLVPLKGCRSRCNNHSCRVVVAAFVKRTIPQRNDSMLWELDSGHDRLDWDTFARSNANRRRLHKKERRAPPCPSCCATSAHHTRQLATRPRAGCKPQRACSLVANTPKPLDFLSTHLEAIHRDREWQQLDPSMVRSAFQIPSRRSNSSVDDSIFVSSSDRRNNFNGLILGGEC